MNTETPEQHHDSLMSPLPSFIVRSLRDDPLYLKCPRCWHYHTVKINHDGLCDGCCRVIVQSYPDHVSAPHILANQDEQRRRFTPTPRHP